VVAVEAGNEKGAGLFDETVGDEIKDGRLAGGVVEVVVGPGVGEAGGGDRLLLVVVGCELGDWRGVGCCDVGAAATVGGEDERPGVGGGGLLGGGRCGR